MDTKSIDLLSLQTRSMQSDIVVKGMAAALTPQLVQVADQIIHELVYTRIDELPESVLDILAWQFNVTWYETEGAIEEKREAIKDALLIKKTQGTPAAVRRVVEIFFGDGQVEEWFDYGGEPGFFRIVTNNPRATGDQAALLINTVNAVKNLRSRLESVIIQSVETLDHYQGHVLHMTDNILLKQVV